MIQEAIPIRQLSNGIKVVFYPVQSEVAHMGVTVLGGSRYEEKDEVGLAHFLEHCFFKGTTKRKTYHVLSRIDSVGGELNAFTTKEEICVYSSFVRTHFDRAAELLADIVINSNFPEKEIEKEKEIILDEINSYLDSPSDRILDDFEYYLFKNHPLGENILGTKESVSNFTQKDLWKYLNKFFHTNNMAISIVGNLPEKKVMATLEKYFAGVPQKLETITPLFFNDYKTFHIEKEESNFQSHVNIGSIAPGYDQEKERRALSLLINVLGGPALNSRLVLGIREKYGYTYSIEANYNPFKDTGYWHIYFGCDERYIYKTINLVEKELNKMREQQFSSIQLHRAKEQYKGQFALSMESYSGLMMGLGKSALMFNQIDSTSSIYQAIDELTVTDLIETAQIYFNENLLSKLIYSQRD